MTTSCESADILEAIYRMSISELNKYSNVKIIGKSSCDAINPVIIIGYLDLCRHIRITNHQLELSSPTFFKSCTPRVNIKHDLRDHNSISNAIKSILHTIYLHYRRDSLGQFYRDFKYAYIGNEYSNNLVIPTDSAINCYDSSRIGGFRWPDGEVRLVPLYSVVLYDNEVTNEFDNLW